jgi:hypothetical protein
MVSQINSKSKILNSKQFQNSNNLNLKYSAPFGVGVLNIWTLAFHIAQDLDI